MSKLNISEKQQQQDSFNFDKRKSSIMSQGSKHFSKPDFEQEVDEEGDITPISTEDNNFMEGLDTEVECEQEIDHSLD